MTRSRRIARAAGSRAEELVALDAADEAGYRPPWSGRRPTRHAPAGGWGHSLTAGAS